MLRLTVWVVLSFRVLHSLIRLKEEKILSNKTICSVGRFLEVQVDSFSCSANVAKANGLALTAVFLSCRLFLSTFCLHRTLF